MTENSRTINFELEYGLKEVPPYYIQGSYVLDRIFGRTSARDIDIFIPEGSDPPQIKSSKKVQLIELSADAYFPPILGCYNTDRYLLIGKEIIRPGGFPERPDSLELLEGYGLTVNDVVRGIKICLRYGLSQKKVKTSWKEALKRQFDPEMMELMLFTTKQEVEDFIIYNLEEETGMEEREKVKDVVEELLGRKIS